MRVALSNARIMIHQPSGGAQGMASDIEIQAKEILRIRSRMNGIYAKYTGQPLERIESAMDRDTFRSEEHTSETQSLMRISNDDCCLKKTNISRYQRQIYKN